MAPGTILIVEDDAAIRAVLRVTLKGAGYELVRETARGDEALALVRELHPSLVLLDVMLPGLDGFSVCRRVREMPEVSTTPIIMLTAKCEERDVVRGLELGADDYIVKPFSRHVLLARIQAVLRRPEAIRPERTEHDGSRDLFIRFLIITRFLRKDNGFFTEKGLTFLKTRAKIPLQPGRTAARDRRKAHREESPGSTGQG